MVGAIINDEKNKTWNQLYINETAGQPSLSGFTLCEGILLEFNKSELNIFKNFILGSHRKILGKMDGYDVILDEDTNLYHFFKDGKEDITKLFFYNGEDATHYIASYSPNHKGSFRKFVSKHLRVALTISYSCFILCMTPLLVDYFQNTLSEEIYIEHYGELIVANKNSIFDTIAFEYEGIDQKIGPSLTSEDIYKVISENEKLTAIERDFVWNPELIELILPYYNKSDDAKVLSLVKFSDLDFVSFSEEEYPDFEGFVNQDGAIHIREYNDQDLKNPTKAEAAGHECIHILQMGGPTFITETSAELLSLEFYMDTAKSGADQVYSEACKYLRILMEIIGSDPILDTIFCPNSTALYENVSPYLNSSEYEEFLSIMSLSPYYDSQKLEQKTYARLSELLSTMYENKFHTSINDDRMISAIINGKDFNRVYFRKSLREKELDWCIALREGARTYSLKDAWENGIVTLTKHRYLSKEEYLATYHSTPDIQINYNLSSNVTINSNPITDEAFIKNRILTLTLEDGSTRDITLEEAESLGYAAIEYFILDQIDYEEYMNSKDNTNCSVWPQGEYTYDYKTNLIYVPNDICKVTVESLSSKFEKENTLS